MIEDAEAAIQLNPQNFKAHVRHGEASIELGKKPAT